MKIVVLGAGLVGGPMAVDLAKDAEISVTVADLREDALARFDEARIETVQADLSKKDIVQRLARDHDMVLSAVPGFMGFETLRSILETGRSCVDIAFFGEDPFALDQLAKETGATAIVDMGVNPGSGSVLAGHAVAQLDSADTILTLVGGLPRVRRWPYEYAAVFSTVDVIEEYVRPARYVERGELVTRPALSDPEYIEFPGVGTLEAFNTDGLRTMAKTMKVPNMKEKTLRYPGHIEKMAVLRETGFFSDQPIEVGGVEVRPVDVTAKLLFPMWKLGPNEADVTVLRVIVEGTKAGKRTRYQYDMIDERDAAGVTSMARTTGYTATAGVRMIMKGMFRERGVFAPEQLGPRRDCVDFLLAELRARNVTFTETISGC